MIYDRPIMEKTAKETDQDQILKGNLLLLTKLLEKYPAKKLEVGTKLINYLLHDCLFEIPHGTKGETRQRAPKCKVEETRKLALLLISCLARDCLENLKIMLDYLASLQGDATWRTKKESDWDLKLYADEKSSTGRVGIKNLGCICYMNSLNQQLFMIPTFRNDILSINDPNHKSDQDDDNLFLQFQTLFSGLQLSEKMYINPKNYCHSFKDWDGNPTNVMEQMDVEEYLNMFMDKLE